MANSAPDQSNITDLATAASNSALSQNDGNSIPLPPLPPEQDHGNVTTQAHDSELVSETSCKARQLRTLWHLSRM